MSMESEFPECPICGSRDGYTYSGVFGKYAACSQCMTKWKLFIKNQVITGLTLHELPKNGAGLYKVLSTNLPLFMERGKVKETAFWKSLKLNGKVEWDYFSSHVNQSLTNYIIKEKKETLLHNWVGKHGTGKWKYPEGSAFNIEANEPGTLLLTSHRIVFLKKSLNQVVFDVSLEDIRGISGTNAGSYIFLSVSDSRGAHKFWLNHTFVEIAKPMIENAISMRKDEIEAEKKRNKVQVLLDFSFLRNEMEKGGLTMQVLKCPECGGKLTFPESGNLTKCSYCGKAIYAQDIFEKIKDLI